jgi:hypothetical protein
MMSMLFRLVSLITAANVFQVPQIADACDVSSLAPFRAVFIGNSLTGGKNVGGKNSEEDRCEENRVPWPTVIPNPNPGDVPSKVKLISDAACQINFQWTQNTRSAHFLSTHAREPDGCRIVNREMIAAAGNGLDVLIVQAQSAELAKTDCEPTTAQEDNLDILLNFVTSSETRKYLFGLWSSYNTGNEICTFNDLKCTQEKLAQDTVHDLDILPVGESFRYIADMSCSLDGSCGYNSSSCPNSLWSDIADGLFVDDIHQSETTGAWLAALVIYGGMQSPVCLPSADLLTPSGLSDAIKTELAFAATFALTDQYGSDLAECSMASQPTTTVGATQPATTTAQEPLTTTTQAPPLTVTKFICKKNEPDASMCDEALDSESGTCRRGGKIWWELECPATGGGSPTPAPVNSPNSAPVDSCFATGEKCDKNGDGTECCSGVCLDKKGGTCQ